MNVKQIYEPLFQRISKESIKGQPFIDWVAASVVTGYLFTVAGQAINATWHTPGWIPSWLTDVQAVVLSGGFYFVTIGVGGTLIAKRIGFGKVAGVLLATLGSVLPFLIWGWVQLPYHQRMQMWKAFRLDGEYRAYIAIAFAIAIVAMAVGHAVGVAVYSLIRGNHDASTLDGGTDNE